MSASIEDAEFEIKSQDDADAVLGDLHRVSSDLRGEAAAMDGELKSVRSRHEGKIKQLDAMVNLRRASLERWASDNRESFGAKKSLDLLHGTIGFRLSMPSLKLRARQKWDDVLEAAKKFRAGLFVREKFEVDKQSILKAEADGDLSTADKEKLGVRVIQEENFFVELKVA